MYIRIHVPVLLLAAVTLTACQVKKSANPLSPSVAGPIPGVSITTPALTSPAPGARIAVDQQPITLTVDNASTSGVRPISYLFEVASDAAFTSILVTQAGIAPDSSGRTSFRLPIRLETGKTYFWRARAQDGANTGGYATPTSFAVYTPIVIEIPQFASPADGEFVTTLTPQLTFRNAARSGPVGTIQYLVLLYADTPNQAGFISAFFVPEGAGGQSTFQVPAGIMTPGGRTYYWVLQATDMTNHSAFSAARHFRSPMATAPTPSPSPSPSPGPGGSSGPGTATDFAALGNVTIVGGSPDVRSWAVTSRITSLRFSPGNIHLEHTKLGQWPGVDIGGALQEATLWVFFRINGQWYGTGGERWRPRQTDKALSAPSAIGPGWFYNNNWAPMTNYRPRPGEQVGFMVVAGSTRADTRAPVRERSQILMVPFPADGVTASFP
ncbi:MAG: hypothetical protein AB7N65_28445 [Vicinamibacterales bacterium]